MKKKNGIESFGLYHLNNGAHFLYLSLVSARAEADTFIYGKCKTTVNELKAAVENEDAALKLSQKSLLTDAIAAADKERDTFYRIYRKAVQGMAKLPEFAQPGKVLNQHLKDYAIDPRMQQDRETGMMVNFIADLDEKFAAEVESLHLTPFVEKMKAANEKVLSLTENRMDERISIPVGALKAARAVSDEAYATLVKAVNVLLRYDETGECQSFVDYVNGEIKHYKQQALASPPGSAGVPVSAGMDAAAGRMAAEPATEDNGEEG